MLFEFVEHHLSDADLAELPSAFDQALDCSHVDLDRLERRRWRRQTRDIDERFQRITRQQ